MSNLSIHIELDNAAFEGDNCGPEVACILRELADKIENTSRCDLEGHSYVPRDANGNCVGTCDFEINDEEENLEEERDAIRHAADKFLKDLTRDQIIKVLMAFDMFFQVEDETYRLKQLVREHVVDEDFTIDDIKYTLGI